MSKIKRALAYEMHAPARKTFPRRRFKVLGIGDLLQGDLVEMQPYAKENNGYRYMLTLIDCFSKKAWAVPIKDKTGINVTKAMVSVLPLKVKNLQTDAGKEFFNKEFKALMEKRNINHYHTFSNMKAAIVERFNKTLKNWMWREFSVQGDYKWLDLLPKLVSKYNNKVHRATGMKPNQVNAKNSPTVYKRLMMLNKKFGDRPPKFKVGDSIRISKYKHVFSKGYTPSWSGEVFTVQEVKGTKPTTYILKDSTGETILGGFYEPELIKTKYKDVALVERVIRRKGTKLFVKWLGYPDSHSTWIDTTEDIV